MQTPALTFTEFSGSPFQIGLAMGRFGATAVHGYLTGSPFWEGVMQWRESEAAQGMQALVQSRHPYIWDELHGLAKGLELPFEDVFLWNCRGDVWGMAPDGCTTVLQPAPDGPRISHNEDGDPGFAGHCAVAEFTVDGGPAFASFIYPGSIPGHTFAVTEYGMAMTVNNVRVRQAAIGLPRMVLTRALLNAPDLSSAVDLLRQSPRSGGFHLSLAQRGGQAMLSVEFTASGVSVEQVKTPILHANHLVHPDMQAQAQHVTQSSQCRQITGERLLQHVEAGHMDALAILADQSDADEPIYRDSPTDSDVENTLATVDMRVGTDQVLWEVYEHPGDAPRFRMLDAKHM